MRIRVRSVALAVAAFALLLSPSSFAQTVTYTAQLKGSDEVPPNDSKGSGMVEAKYDPATMKLSYKVDYTGLSGPATSAHFHGPAKPGVNAPPVISMTDLASPMKGDATLTAPQAAELANGMWYFNVHTAAHPGGEIRGQLMKK